MSVAELLPLNTCSSVTVRKSRENVKPHLLQYKLHKILFFLATIDSRVRLVRLAIDPVEREALLKKRL